MYENYFAHLRAHLKTVAQKKRSAADQQVQRADNKDVPKSKTTVRKHDNR